ncbi:thioredoxin domain-containing protein [Pseudomonas sp. CCM 7893]|uniref:Thiol:disulfide interchange protein n=1 Tax=Pseudomonas spelaei TaxID=1055469 RepID=A0A6I3WEY0_9PSED|nr:thiol:disulfide interchange protein DsbA/DsbL [Pseudomonas spelaei]MUF06484.1 thioredoxin domain-containing protein [Pseudomonas spelaei]
MKKILLTLIAPALFTAPLAMANSSTAPVAGKNYKITEEKLSESPKVIEFFSYLCGHCRDFDPAVAAWAAGPGKDVAIKQVPVSFGNKQWTGYAKAFYVSEALNMRAVTHKALFDLANNGVKLDNDEAIAAFFIGLGADKILTNQTIKSFAVNSKIAEGDRLAMHYRIREVPSFVANDKFVTSPSMSASNEAMLDMLSALCALHDTEK